MLLGKCVRELDEILNRRDVKALAGYLDENPQFINGSLKWGNTLLSLVVQCDDVPMVSLMLERGADPNLIYTRFSPIRLGESDTEVALCKVESINTLNLLLEYGANVNVTGIDRSILYCVVRNGEISVANALYQLGAKMNEKEKNILTEMAEEELAYRKENVGGEERMNTLSSIITFCKKC
jgi:ankyrin repeat protein